MPELSKLQIALKNFGLYDKEVRPWPNPKLTNTAIVGHVTQTTARLWMRVYEPGEYWIALSNEKIDTAGIPRVPDPALPTLEIELYQGGISKPAAHLLRATFGYESDLTATVDFENLTPDTRYYYKVFAAFERKEIWEIGRELPLSFRTQSPSKDVTFGLISCHMPYSSKDNIVNMDMWEALHAEMSRSDADFLIAGGDQVYTDGHRDLSIWKLLKSVKSELPKSRDARIEIMKSWYRDIYRGYWGHEQLKKVLRSFPTYMIWDDHEIMDGWGSYDKDELSDQLDTILEFEDRELNLKLAGEMREVAELVYREYQHAHNPVTGHEGLDYCFNAGECAFYVLDMRGARDFTRKTDDKILGAAQMDRFLKWLGGADTAKATAVFIVSPVPVLHASSFVVNNFDIPTFGLADDLRDEWDHESNWKERDRMLDVIFDLSSKRGQPFIFLSGDVHIGAAFRLERASAPSAKVYQLTSSAITYASAPGWLLQLIVKDSGELGGTVGKSRTKFRLLQKFARNNFGILKVRHDGATPATITWDLYGAAQDADAIVRLKTLVLG